jgi:hypothetical protein
LILSLVNGLEGVRNIGPDKDNHLSLSFLFFLSLSLFPSFLLALFIQVRCVVPIHYHLVVFQPLPEQEFQRAAVPFVSGVLGRGKDATEALLALEQRGGL